MYKYSSFINNFEELLFFKFLYWFFNILWVICNSLYLYCKIL